MTGDLNIVNLPALAGPGQMADLGLRIERQLTEYWCWAAVTASVHNFFAPGNTLRQCDVSGRVLGGVNCCSTPPKDLQPPCNQTWNVTYALRLTQHLVEPGAVPIRIENIPDLIIDQRTPLVVVVAFSNGAGHCLAVVGARRAGAGLPAMVRLSDPIYGLSDVTLETLRGTYQGSGVCREIYRTR